jgi:hypothetical protein
MRRFLISLLSLAALVVPATSWEASTSSNLAITVTAGQAISAVGLSNSSFTGGAASGTVVGAISVTMSPASPAFSGSLSLSGTNASSFQIVGSNLETNGTVPAGTYNINIVATEAGASGSPFTQAETVTGTNPAIGDSVAFTPLHTYYMSATGSDSNSGTSSSSPWATPNHSQLVCGDVIIAAPGAYPNLGISTNPGTCPSTSGGIDGTGGIYFVTVLCSTSFACTISDSGGAIGGIDVSANNWAFEGWYLSGTGASGTGGRSFQADACASGTTILHHIAFVNDISANAEMGYGINDCALNHNVPGNGTDYWAVVGSIAMNSAADPICLAAIDAAGPTNYDKGSGTHIFFGGDFSYANRTTCGSDVEGMMFDTWDAHGFTGQGVIEQSMVWDNDRNGIQLFYQGINPTSPVIQIFNNTLYANDVGQDDGESGGALNLQASVSSMPWEMSIYNNISRTSEAQGANGGYLYAALTGGGYNVTWGGAGIQNIFKGSATSCTGSCDPGDNVVAYNGGPIGTNTYVDPAFANTSDLLSNQSATPNCSGSTNVAACMGWNYATQTARVPSVISDLTPTASGMAGKGYQPPGACTADPYYPTWLKGIVYLQWNGSSITENAGLLTKPCGL